MKQKGFCLSPSSLMHLVRQPEGHMVCKKFLKGFPLTQTGLDVIQKSRLDKNNT